MSSILSVIVPVYNCAEVVVRCLDSIDYPDAEIIVVDDGSKDNTKDVVLAYQQSHPNVLLLHKENGGVSSARNLGLKKAHGKYIMFVDADDYVVPGGIGKLIDEAENLKADVVKFSYCTVANDACQDVDSLKEFLVSSELIENGREALKRNDVPDYLVWDGVYRREVILNNHIRFHEDLYLHEDDVFMGEFYCHAGTIAVTNLPLYRYVVSSTQSSTHNQNVEKQRRLIESSYLAIKYRATYVQQFCQEAMPLERLKYMRWVCQPKTAIEAGYSLNEYRQVLDEFKKVGCWPLDYRWIHVARLDWSLKVRMKNRIKTFLCNHPGLAYYIFKGERK